MDQVEEIKNKVDIVEVIGENVTLKKAGRNYKGLCPFHSEKTPSFMVNPELQIFKCFGCGEGGDVITFLEKYENLEFYEALKILADKAGVKLKKLDYDKTGLEREKLIAINEEAARLYHFILLKHALGREFLEYAKVTRGFNEDTIKNFEIGASPNNNQVLVKHLRKKGYGLEEIEKAGLVYRGRRGYADRFYGRLTFPIRDHRGRVIAMAGRILPRYDSDRAGKYINSPETLIYKKSESLYGLSNTKQDIKRAKKVIVVEGEIDLISVWQSGVRNVVAIKGSAFTAGQAALLSRFTNEVILALDSDFAGDKAAFSGIEILSKAGIITKVCKLGKYKDPDEFVRDNPKGFREAVNNTQDVWDFMINSILAKHDIKSGTGKAQAAAELMPILAAIDERITLMHYAKLLGERLDTPLEVILEQIEGFAKKKEIKPVAPS
jgi:DNA primase